MVRRPRRPALLIAIALALVALATSAVAMTEAAGHQGLRDDVAETVDRIPAPVAGARAVVLPEHAPSRDLVSARLAPDASTKPLPVLFVTLVGALGIAFASATCRGAAPTIAGACSWTRSRYGERAPPPLRFA